MKRTILTLFIINLILISCKEKPTYNPFDNQFELDKNHLLKSGMDTIVNGCGYYSLQFLYKKFSPFYQYYYGEDKVLSKGFFYTIDTIISKTTNIDSIKNLSIDLTDLNQRLKKYKKIISKKEKKLVISPVDTSKIVYIGNHVSWINDSTFIRNINFYKVKNEY